MQIVNEIKTGRKNFIAEVSDDGGETTKKVIVISDNDDNTDDNGDGTKTAIGIPDVDLFLKDCGYTVYNITE